VSDWTIAGNYLRGTGTAGNYNLDIDGASRLNVQGNIVSGYGVPARFGPDTATIQYADNAFSGNFQIPTTGILLASSTPGTAAWTGAYNALAFGAVGNGVTDDTAALQRAIDAAQATGGTLFLPSRKYLLSASLRVRSGVKIVGTGYQSSGSQFVTTNSAAYPVQWETLRGGTTLIQTNPAASVFVVSTAQAIEIENLEIYYYDRQADVSVDRDAIYYARALSGASGVAIDADGGAFNASSILRDLFIQGADRCLSFRNSEGYLVDNLYCYDARTFGIWHDSDPSRAANTLKRWVVKNSTFITGTGHFYQHIAIFAGGPGSIETNKLNGSGNCTQRDLSGMGGITVAPYRNVAGGYDIGPLQVIGNSIEGQKIAISMQLGPNANATLKGIAIRDNQFWAGTDVHSSSGPHNPKWIESLVVARNELQSHGTDTICHPVAYNLVLDGINGAIVTGNLLNSINPVTQAVYVGPNVSGLQYGGNFQLD
jgi:hypothetical protein